jgi:hypothetical protein
MPCNDREKRLENCKRWREKNKEEIKEYYRTNKNGVKTRKELRRKKNRLFYLKEKSKLKCSRCNENHISCLEFHHLDPSKKESNVSCLSGYSYQRIKKEMEKCIILCSNCHKKEHWDDDKFKKIEKEIKILEEKDKEFSYQRIKKCRICKKTEDEIEFVKGRYFCKNCYKISQKDKMKERRQNI